MRTSVSTSLLVGLALTASPANGQGFEDLDVIDLRASVLAATLGQQAVAVDRRIKLPRCPERAVIQTIDSQALAARCLPLGWRVRIALVPVVDAVGQTAVPADLVAKRGDHLRLRIQRDGFVLIYDVVATANGRAGDVIPVRAEGTKTLLRARLLGPGQAMLTE
jgi:flagellar basal body P-ring formation protein FlgA